MYYSLIRLTFFVHILSLLGTTWAATGDHIHCPPEGPHYARPLNLDKSELLQRALNNVTRIIHSALNGTLDAGWNVPNTSFSVAIVSLQSRKPIWEYHHRAAGNVYGTKKVDGDSQYLLGSMSKMVFDLMLMKSGIDLNTLVTDYIPELKVNSSKIQWGEITLSALSTHLAGIPTNFGFSEYYWLRDTWKDLGIPLPPDSAYFSCGVAGLNYACSREDFIRGMVTIEPVTNVNRRPTYSGLAFVLLSWALTAHTGKPFKQLLDELLITPLDLKNTGASPGNDSKAVIPPDNNWWGIETGDAAAGGGLYSSLNDMSAIMHSVLSRSYMPESKIFEWLKPTAFTDSRGKAVGRPFEIYRYFNLTPEHPQTIDVYAKGGSAYGYSSLFSIIDQYGVGIIWLTAGDATVRSLLPDVLVSQFIPALEEETRKQATEQYAKVFVSAPSSRGNGTWNSTALPMTMNITLDTYQGLILQNLTRGNYSLTRAYAGIYQSTFGKLLGLQTTLYSTYRMFPTDRLLKGEFQGKQVLREEWRIKWDTIPDANTAKSSSLPGVGLSSDVCATWLDTDWIHLAGEAINKYFFVRDAKTLQVIGAEIPWLRASLVVKE